MKSVAKTAAMALLCGSMSLTLTACGGSASTMTEATGGTAAEALNPILANPQVGDVYAAELTAFSGASFNTSGESTAKAYGLLRVVAVADDKVTVITETGAWPTPSPGPANDMNGDFHDISWDESERIPIMRGSFQQLLDDDKIIDVRRPPAATSAAPAAAAAPAVTPTGGK